MEAKNEANRQTVPTATERTLTAATAASSSSHPRSTTTKHQTKTPWLTKATVFQLLFAFRLLNALLVRTYFQPDEYYQALEPAWWLAFGGDQSAAWITWEWRQHIRSALHPSIFALVYKIADFIAKGLSLSAHTRAEVLLVAPKVLQAGIAAGGDYYTWRLGAKIYGRDSAPAWTTLVLSVFNPWLWFCSTRTFSNCAEGTLTVFALGVWPWDWCVKEDNGSGQRLAEGGEGESGPGGVVLESGRSRVRGLRKALVSAAVATVLRPTNVLIWASVAAYTVFKAFTIDERRGSDGSNSTAGSVRETSPSAWSKVFLLMREVVVCGGSVLVVSAIIDRFFYGSWTFPPYNFLHFNVFQSLAVFYGNNNWHFYLTSGYPSLLTANVPFIIACSTQGFKHYAPFATLSANSRSMLRGLAIVCITLPVALSFLTHKEVRFIYPILSPLLVIAALPASEFKLAFTTRGISAVDIRNRRWRQRGVMGLFLLLVISITGFLTRLHDYGPLAVSDYLRHEFETVYLPRSVRTSEISPNRSIPDMQARNMTVAFLMPCHSVPWRSHLQYPPTESHIGIQAWALTCEPPLHLTDALAKKTYLDEADIFYENPRAWIRRNMARKLPSRSESDKGRNVESGVHVAEEALDHRNKKLWDGTRSTSRDIKSYSGLDITDLLPYLSTSPPSPSNLTNMSKVSSISTSSTSNPAIPTRRPWPDYIVSFAQLTPHLCSVLPCYGPGSRDVYSERWRVFNSFLHGDWRRKGDVVVWCLNSRFERDGGRKVNTEGIEERMGVDLYDDDDDVGDVDWENTEGEEIRDTGRREHVRLNDEL